MAALLDPAAAAAGQIRAWLPEDAPGVGRVTVDVYGGRVGEASLTRLSTRAPAVYVAFLRTEANDDAGDATRCVLARYAAVVLGRAKDSDLDADAVAEAIAAVLLVRIPEAQWNLSALAQAQARRLGIPERLRDLRGIGGAHDVRLDNGFADALAEKRIALWTVTWKQEVRMGAASPERPVDGPATELWVTPRLRPWPERPTERIHPR
ncbi:MAG: hypothetical protein OXB97_04440 [Rhodospirillales bacterium]|nr:hypothetical protein [Rhodospirillales bacterium]